VKVLTLPAVTATLAAEIPLSVIPVDFTTDYRGRLGLRADETPPMAATVGDYRVGRLDFDEPRVMWDTRKHAPPIALPLGAVVASCTLVDVAPILGSDGCTDASAHLCVANSRALLHSALDRSWPDGETEHDVTAQHPYGDFSPTGPCPTCGGSGHMPRDPVGRGRTWGCPTCDGSGTVQRYALVIDNVKATTARCPRCWGGRWLCDTHDRPRCSECYSFDGSEHGCPSCHRAGVCPPVPMPGHPDRLTEATWPT
jgi:hypothetical protein